MKPWESEPDRCTELFEQKCDRVESRLRPFGPPPATRVESPPSGYRVRAEFRLWHDQDNLDFVMFDPATPGEPVPVTAFPQALTTVQSAMPALLSTLRPDSELRRKVFQAEFLASRDGDLVITLAYHRKLEQEWLTRAPAITERTGASLIGRSRKQKIVLGNEYIEERFWVAGQSFRMRAYEQSFVQPNAPVNEQMLNWVCSQAIGSQKDLLELYCGNGNFTLPLAHCHRKVLATEVAKNGTRAALENITNNGIPNIDLARLSAAEVVQALTGEREFKRLKNLSQSLRDFEFEAVLVDPPRQGLDDATCEFIQGFERIYYVSCNPDTLIKNLGVLSNTHRIAAIAFFDQFPYTEHLETGLVLQRAHQH
ncbi:MAG: tRNA (uridine(54)-C5)-methyltransferase TrmA [Pseudomonadota bacterium]